MLLLYFQTQAAPAAAGYINAATLVSNIWPPLNAVSAADAVFWSEEEIYNWFNEAAKRLSRSGGAFVVRDTTLTSALSTALYALPAAHQVTIQCDLAGLVLRPRTVQEIEALDAAWPNTSGPPIAFLLDVQGVKTLALYPQADVANAGKAIGLVMRTAPDDVTAPGGFLLFVSPALSEFFTFYILREARSKETRAQMPEIAQWFGQLCGQLEQVVQGYMGEA
jgi:hypothetical protein